MSTRVYVIPSLTMHKNGGFSLRSFPQPEPEPQPEPQPLRWARWHRLAGRIWSPMIASDAPLMDLERESTFSSTSPASGVLLLLAMVGVRLGRGSELVGRG